MKNLFIKFIPLVILIALVLLNAGILTCEAKSDSSTIQSQVKYKDESSEKNEDLAFLDDQTRRFKILVLAVKQNIIEQYKTLENLEVAGDYLQFIEYCEVSD